MKTQRIKRPIDRFDFRKKKRIRRINKELGSNAKSITKKPTTVIDNSVYL